MKMTRIAVSAVASLACMFVLATGCSNEKSKSVAYSDAKTGSAKPVHVHPTEGPHKGELIELGNEEYHAELVVPTDTEGQVSIYVLDGAAVKTVAIEAKEVTVNIADGGSPAQFKLAASPDKGDSDGKSSRFVSTDAKLLAFFKEDAVHGKLVLKINGKQFQGDIDHHVGL